MPPSAPVGALTEVHTSKVLSLKGPEMTSKSVTEALLQLDADTGRVCLDLSVHAAVYDLYVFTIIFYVLVSPASVNTLLGTQTSLFSIAAVIYTMDSHPATEIPLLGASKANAANLGDVIDQPVIAGRASVRNSIAALEKKIKTQVDFV